ncbi:MAG TPA: PH domain-containing protein [Mycobacteriales bacterium]|nr:PH domain-containing protein [Mycobacteriales bacterium]
MGFPENILDSDEHVIRNLRPHWRKVAGPVVLAPIVVGLASYGWFSLPDDSARKVLRWVILLAALVILLWWSLRPFLFWLTTRYVVTDRRVLMRHGVLSRNGRDVPLTRVNDVSFNRSVVERLFGSGTLVIESAGDRGQVALSDVPHVEAVQRDIYRLVEDEAQRLR